MIVITKPRENITNAGIANSGLATIIPIPAAIPTKPIESIW